MKAIFIYNPESGRRNFQKHSNKIKNELASTFEEMLFLSPKSEDDAFEIYQNIVPKYDALIVIGGDGSLNLAINELMKMKKRPVLGYINAGTLGDGGKSFGVGKSLQKALEIIKKKNIKFIDIGEVEFEDRICYFLYCLAYGAYSSIPYMVKDKRHMRKYTYYFRSLNEMFVPKTYSFAISIGERTLEKECPFIMLLNGKNMGGFSLNKHTVLDDGIIEGYFPSKSFLNGISRFLPFKKEKGIAIKEAEITPKDDGFWCLDGEKGGKGRAKIRVISNEISIFSR